MTRYTKKAKVTYGQRWIIYCRYSPRPTEVDSIRKQAELLEAYVARKGGEIVSINFDEDISGSVPLYKRPGLICALEQLKEGDLLLVRDTSRCARSLSVSLAIEERIHEVGARLAVALEGGIQKTLEEDPSAWGWRMVMSVFATIERIQKAKLTSATMKRRQSRGDKMGGTAPLGKVIIDKQLIAVAGEEEAIARITELHAQGKGAHAIATQLGKDGYKPRGRAWHPKTVFRLLSRLQSQ